MASNHICKAILFCFFVGFALGDAPEGLAEDPHSIYQCPDPTSVEVAPLCNVNVNEGAQFFATITKTVECPESNVNRHKIGCIIVKDLSENDNGGYATIASGGLDQFYVTIRLKSQWGKGLKYHIEVYNLVETTTAVSAAAP